MPTHLRVREVECLHTRGSPQAAGLLGEVGGTSIVSAMGNLIDLVAGSGVGYSLFVFYGLCEARGMLIC